MPVKGTHDTASAARGRTFLLFSARWRLLRARCSRLCSNRPRALHPRRKPRPAKKAPAKAGAASERRKAKASSPSYSVGVSMVSTARQRHSARAAQRQQLGRVHDALSGKV